MSGVQKKVINQYITNRVKWWVWAMNKLVVLKDLLELTTEVKDQLTAEDKTKISDFHQKILDNVIVSGGVIPSMLLGEKVNDIDVYFKTVEVAELVANYYVNLMICRGKLDKTNLVSRIDVVPNNTSGVAVFIKSQGIAGEDIDTNNYQYFEMMEQNAVDEFLDDYHRAVKQDELKPTDVKNITSNAITLNNGIQIVLRFTGEPAVIHENYDFAHATSYWTESSGVVYAPIALQALLEKRLYYIGSKFPVASLFRLRKFLARGFRISAGEITKIAYDISKLNLDNPAVLHDQLIGVDYAYFHEVISILRKQSDRQIDRTYLFEIIDLVFQDMENTQENNSEEYRLETPSEVYQLE